MPHSPGADFERDRTIRRRHGCDPIEFYDAASVAIQAQLLDEKSSRTLPPSIDDHAELSCNAGVIIL
jgi:hypothetical protein